MNRRLLATSLVLISLSSHAFAADKKPQTVEDPGEAFRLYADLPVASIKVPTVVEVPLGRTRSLGAQMAVLDKTDNRFVAHLVVNKDVARPVQIRSNAQGGADSFLNDQKFDTFVDFDLPQDRTGEALLTFTADEPFTADALSIALARHVAMPEKIEITAEVNGVSKIILAENDQKGVRSSFITFPETTASKWQVRLRYGQPLRIAEIDFRQTKRINQSQSSARFLMQPGHAYRLLGEPDRYTSISVGESGDLRTDRGVMRLDGPDFKPNETYREADIDKDGVPDIRDNCVSVANPDQTDIDGNLRGDACDDYDRDGVINSKDNCPDQPNAAQTDKDGDGTGDVCDNEESRVTEKYPWLSWLALGGVAALMAFFFTRVAKGMPPKPPQA